MSLSYVLDATNYPWWNKLGDWLGNGNSSLAFAQGQLMDGGNTINPRWLNFTGSGSPTGEYVIRDGYYHNGIYIIVGSYRAYWQEIYGTGAPGYAWDGFILMHRGYNVTTTTSADLLSAFDPINYTVFPMLWPQTMEATTPANWDNESLGIGLYAVAPFKSRDTNDVGTAFSNISFAVCGHHITAAAIPTDSKTVASWALLNFDITAGSIPGGLPTYSWNNALSFQIGPVDQTAVEPVCRFGVTRTWQATIAMNPNALAGVPAIYEKTLWDNGIMPDGSNPSFGAPTSSDNSIESSGYLPLTAYGMRSVAGVTIGATPTDGLDAVFYLTGQMASSNAAKTQELAGPYVMGISCPEGVQTRMKDNLAPLDNLSFYAGCNTAFRSTLTGAGQPAQTGWFTEDTSGGTNPSLDEFALRNAAGTDILPPAEFVSAIAFATASPIAISVTNMEFDGSTANPRSAIFLLTVWPTFPDPTIPWGQAGGSLTAVTEAAGNKVELPTTWHHTLQQFRTYTFDEENAAMRVAITSSSQNDSSREATPDSIFDNDTKQFVGYVGNYPRYDTAPTGGFQAGFQSFQGYAAVGWYDPADTNLTATGPCLFSYDKGTPVIENLTPSATPVQGFFNTAGRLREDGAKVSAALGTFLGTRQCMWAGWDNDRDQWLFITSDTTAGVDVISVDAPYTTFLKQSEPFKPYTESPDWGNAKYLPISMSNALDGLVVFGELIEDNYGNTGVKAKTTGIEVVTSPWGATYNGVLTSQLPAFRVTGTTGRQSRVWIDYMLYDGVDSVIAMQLRDWGMRVTVENVEWFKARILQNGGDLTAKSEEIEEWMEQQGKEYQDMLKQKERSGRLRKRRSQVSAYKREVGDLMTRDQMDTQVYDFVPKGIAAMQRLKDSEGALKSVPPDSIEAMVERDYRAGFDTTPSGVTEPGDQLAEDPAKPAGTFMDTGDAPKKAPDEGGDPDEEYISEN